MDSAEILRRIDMHPLYKQLVKDIIADMKNGILPWVRPWSDSMTSVIIGTMEYSADMWPSNVRAPAVPFGILNGMQLLQAARKKKFRTNLWLTAKVRKELGAELGGDREPTDIIAYFSDSNAVYNIEQIRNYEETLGLTIRNAPPVKPELRHKKSEAQLKKLKRKGDLIMTTGGLRAAYIPARDIIQMPTLGQFTVKNKDTGEAHYWATLWHEVIHWTGHDKRLRRTLNTNKHSNEYAFEELVAEMGSAFLCARLGVKGDLQHSAYIGSWIKMFASDPLVLYKAAEQADKARDFVIQGGKKEKQTTKPATTPA